MILCGHCQAAIPADAERCPGCGQAPAEPVDELIGRELLGRYRIVRLIAEGGMGRVYVAAQAVGSATRQVAVKVLRRQLGTDPQLATRFAREAETLVRLTHPNTVQLFDFGALADGTLALVMEYVRGHSLTAELAHGPLPLPRVQRILTQICGALKEAHGYGIVHRDLKPDNVLIADREGHADFVKVLDFGIARVSELDPKRTKLTQQGMMIGTPPYMSPEQFMGEQVDARSDIYSLGLIAYELLSGRLPFEANTPWEWASKHMTAAPAPLPVLNDGSLPSGQAHALQRALAKKPADRPQTVDAFLEEFFAADPPRSAPRTGQSNSHERPDTKLQSDERERAVSAASVTAQNAADEGELPGRTRRRPAVVAAVCAALLVAVLSLLAGRTLYQSGSSDALQAGAGAHALPSLPRTLPATERPLPSGVTVPETTTSPVVAAAAVRGDSRPARGRPRAEARALDRPLEAEVQAPSEPPATVKPAVELRPVEPPSASGPAAAVAPASTAASAPRAQNRTPSQAMKPTTAPRDLADRILAIRAALTRPEVAVGLYQAAAARYDAHPLLREVRGQVSDQAAKRMQELISGGRCAQAQALQRALTSIGAASSTAKLFGSRCALP